MLILLTCGCCWAVPGCLFPRGLIKCGSALHPSAVPAQQALDMPPPCLLEMESAEAAAEVEEASLLRAELDSKVQCCDGAAVIKVLFIPFLLLAVLRKAVDAEATGGVVGAAASAPALVTHCLKVDTSQLSCCSNRLCSEKQNNSTPNRRAAITLILTETITTDLCQVQQRQSPCAAWRGGSTSVGRHCQT